MIIADLSHFEEVVSDVPSVVGGKTTVSTSSVLPSAVKNELPADFYSLLKDTKGKVTTVVVTNKSGTASSTTGVLKKGKTQIKVANVSSTSSL